MSDVLSKEIYIGHYRVKDIEIKDEALRIIDDDTFQQVQELLKERGKFELNSDGRILIKKIGVEGTYNCEAELIRI